MIAADAADVLPDVVAGVPRGTPVVVFHAATRLHVAAGRRERFDAAIAGIARHHELFHLSFEESERTGDREAEPVFDITLRHGTGSFRLLGIGDGHAEWLAGPEEDRPDRGRTDGPGRTDGMARLTGWQPSRDGNPHGVGKSDGLIRRRTR
jgi:Uncharacterized protein conserved in bacteria (DUF2332)